MVRQHVYRTARKSSSSAPSRIDQLTNARKLEHMDDDCFSQTAFGDEAAARMHRYEYICRELEKIYENLPEQEKDAFFPDDIDEGAGSLFYKWHVLLCRSQPSCIKTGQKQ